MLSHDAASPSQRPTPITVGGEPVSDADHLDLAGLDEIFGGASTSFARELARIFLADVTRRLGHLRDSVELGNASSSMKIAHTVRGASINFGAVRLAELADRVERYAELESRD